MWSDNKLIESLQIQNKSPTSGRFFNNKKGGQKLVRTLSYSFNRSLPLKPDNLLATDMFLLFKQKYRRLSKLRRWMLSKGKLISNDGLQN